MEYVGMIIQLLPVWKWTTLMINLSLHELHSTLCRVFKYTVDLLHFRSGSFDFFPKKIPTVASLSSAVNVRFSLMASLIMYLHNECHFLTATGFWISSDLWPLEGRNKSNQTVLLKTSWVYILLATVHKELPMVLYKYEGRIYQLLYTCGKELQGKRLISAGQYSTTVYPEWAIISYFKNLFHFLH